MDVHRLAEAFMLIVIAEESVSTETPAADSVIWQEVDDPVTHSGSVNFSWITPYASV